MSHKKVERNQKIIDFYFNRKGYSYNALARIFLISPARVAKIINTYKKEQAK